MLSERKLNPFPRVEQVMVAMNGNKLRRGPPQLRRDCCPGAEKDHVKVHGVFRSTQRATTTRSVRWACAV